MKFSLVGLLVYFIRFIFTFATSGMWNVFMSYPKTVHSKGRFTFRMFH